MPKNKDLKKLVRARMEKTGEAYSTARLHIVKSSEPQLPDNYEELAGQRDEVVVERTGATWRDWVERLDGRNGVNLEHGEIAKIVGEYIDDGWWAQTITVGYERLKGLRQVGQKRTGEFEANKSKTIHAGADTIFAALTDDGFRTRWLQDEIEVRHVNPGKSVRLNWPDGTRVVFYLTSKSADRTTVAVQHLKLESPDDIVARKEYWGPRLSELAELLT